MASGPDSGKSPFDIDLTDTFARMKLPLAPNMEAVFASQRRNIEALAAANKVAMDGAQAVAKRNLEILQQSMTDLSESMLAMAAPGEPEQRLTKQAELARKAFENAATNMKELGEMIQRANAEAMGVLNRRFAEAVEEVKHMANPAKPGA
jgi:phasin family protein